ncbi:MAG: phosphotriesterase [Verrucomicrobia bacterium]|nr:phosphotriesterase [Verrucomicrobiota bacterium]
MNRRDFLSSVSGAALLAGCAASGKTQAREIMTVTGPIPADQLGRTLIHEHVVVDFLGAGQSSPQRYDPEQAFDTALPHFQELHARGVDSLVECTPRYIGRNPTLLRRLSEASGVRIITNAGWYAAVDHKYLPPAAATESAGQIAEQWLAEWTAGIEGTGIRPGFLKLGTGNGPLPAVDATLVRAAARVHKATGLTIAIHTGNGEAARDEVRLLREEGVRPDALIWVHAQNDAGPVQIELAHQGVWISLDGYSLSPGNTLRYPNMVLALRDAGLLHRVLLSHDDGWAVEGDAPSGNRLALFGNGNPVPYQSLFTRLLPDLRQRGLTPEDEEQLLVRNPREALTLRRRLTGDASGMKTAAASLPFPA